MFEDVETSIRERPSFGLYLAALAALPIGWLSPLSSISERSTWTDVLVAAALVLWAWERLRGGQIARRPPLLGVWVALGAYLLFTVLSGAFAAEDRHDAVINILLTAELIGLAVLTADYARGRRELGAIVLVIMLGALLTVALAAVGFGLFYLGVDTRLTGGYGEIAASNSYARVRAGFFSAPLLASYCIFAAAVMAIDCDVPRRLRRGTELALAPVVILTLSRGILGFFVAMGIRAAGARRSARARALAVAAAVLAVGAMVALTVGLLHLDPTRPSTISYTVPAPDNRREAFSSSLGTLGDHLLLGAGPGAITGQNRGVPFRAHFTPLNVAATVGLPALIALSVALALLWTRRGRPTAVALWSGFAGIAIDALGQDVEHFRHVWVLIGLAAASAIVAGTSGSTGGGVGDQEGGSGIAIGSSG